MPRLIALATLMVVALAATAANPPAGQAGNADVAISAVFLDAAAVVQATGADYAKNYTVLEVTVTPKGGKAYDVQPDDFLLRVSSDTDSSGPLAASQVLGAGSGLVVHRDQPLSIGINRANSGVSGVTAATGRATVPADAITALQSKMLPAKTTPEPVSGLLFFPIAKKKPKDLDLVYTTPDGKLHIAFR